MSTRNARSPMRRLGLLVAVLAFGAAGAVSAQPVGPHHGPHGRGDLVTQALHAAKTQLNLNTAQQAEWDKVVADTRAARQNARTNGQAVRAAMQAELAKAEPDFAAVAAVADGVEAKNHQVRVDIRNEWLGFYSRLTAEQKAIVKQIVTQRIARMEQMRERFLQRHPSGG